MITPPESSSLSDEELETVAESLKWQVASAKAAAAKHRARLIDQLDFTDGDVTSEDAAPEDTRQSA